VRRLLRLDVPLAVGAGLIAWHAGPQTTLAVAIVLVGAAVLLTRKAR
jgi:hypothetical protein